MTKVNTVNMTGNEKNFNASRVIKYADSYLFNRYAFMRILYKKKNAILHISVVSMAMSSLVNLLFFIVFSF